MSNEILHAGVLVITLLMSFYFGTKNRVQEYILIFAAIYIFLFIIRKFFLTKHSHWRIVESVLFTLTIMIIVNTTGGVSSAFFFLIYFLIFSLSLLLEPIVSVVTTLSLITLFVLTLPQGQSLYSLLPIFSLAFLSPFAMLLGAELIEIKKTKLNAQNSFLNLTVSLKERIKRIKQVIEKFSQKEDLSEITKEIKIMEKLIAGSEEKNSDL